jgi:hypothetical protein
MPKDFPTRLTGSGGYALPHRAHEEDRSISSPAPGTDPQLLPGAKNDFQRGRQGLNSGAKVSDEPMMFNR